MGQRHAKLPMDNGATIVLEEGRPRQTASGERNCGSWYFRRAKWKSSIRGMRPDCAAAAARLPGAAGLCSAERALSWPAVAPAIERSLYYFPFFGMFACVYALYRSESRGARSMNSSPWRPPRRRRGSAAAVAAGSRSNCGRRSRGGAPIRACPALRNSRERMGSCVRAEAAVCALSATCGSRQPMSHGRQSTPLNSCITRRVERRCIEQSASALLPRRQRVTQHMMVIHDVRDDGRFPQRGSIR